MAVMKGVPQAYSIQIWCKAKDCYVIILIDARDRVDGGPIFDFKYVCLDNVNK